MAHWYVVGANADRLEEIRGAGHLVDAFDGPLDADEQTALWRQLSQAAPDGLWITWSALEPPEIAGLRRLRVAQPALQIVVEIPADLTPPNPDLAQLVALGIYGIVTESADFAEATSRPYTYADAAHWQGGSVAWEDEKEPAKPLKPIQWRTVEVEKKIAVSARPVLIAVVGVSPGVGCTTTAVSIASLLAAMNHEVALAEVGNAPAALASWAEDLPKGITPFANPAPDPLELVRRREWAYIVVDAGAIPSWDVIRDWQADLTILCGPGDHHRFARWESLARAVPIGTIAVGAVVGGGKNAPKVVDGLQKEAELPAFAVADPNTKHRKDNGGALLDLLAPVLPDSRPRHRWWTAKSRPVVAKDRPESAVAQKPDPDWKYAPSPIPAPAYMPPAPVAPQSLNIQVARPGVSGATRAWRLFRDAIMLWALASIVAWVIDLWNTNTAGTAPAVTGRIAVWAGWILQIDRAILHHL